MENFIEAIPSSTYYHEEMSLKFMRLKFNKLTLSRIKCISLQRYFDPLLSLLIKQHIDLALYVLAILKRYLPLITPLLQLHLTGTLKKSINEENLHWVWSISLFLHLAWDEPLRDRNSLGLVPLYKEVRPHILWHKVWSLGHANSYWKNLLHAIKEWSLLKNLGSGI